MIHRYLKSWFTLDLISSLPLHYIILLAAGEPENVYLGLKGASRALKFLKVVKLLNLLKLLRLSRIIRGIAQYEDVSCEFFSEKLMCIRFINPLIQLYFGTLRGVYLVDVISYIAKYVYFSPSVYQKFYRHV